MTSMTTVKGLRNVARVLEFHNRVDSRIRLQADVGKWGPGVVSYAIWAENGEHCLDEIGYAGNVIGRAILELRPEWFDERWADGLEPRDVCFAAVISRSPRRSRTIESISNRWTQITCSSFTSTALELVADLEALASISNVRMATSSEPPIEGESQPTDLIDIKQAAKVAGCSPKTVLRRVKDGILRAYGAC